MTGRANITIALNIMLHVGFRLACLQLPLTFSKGCSYVIIWQTMTYRDDNGILPDFPRRVPIDTNIADIVFTSSNVLRQLKNLKVNSSAGPDGIKPIFL